MDVVIAQCVAEMADDVRLVNRHGIVKSACIRPTAPIPRAGRGRETRSTQHCVTLSSAILGSGLSTLDAHLRAKRSLCGSSLLSSSNQ